MLLEIFMDYAGRYGEHFCKYLLQPNEYKNLLLCVIKQLFAPNFFEKVL